MILPITAIGSLPHHNMDSAIEHALSWGVPFAPQIPMRNPKEFMLSQALDGFPGFYAVDRGEGYIDKSVWQAASLELKIKMDEALKSLDEKVMSFLPLHESYSCFRPFLWEVMPRNISKIKIQLAGPLTCQWSIKLSDGRFLRKEPEIETCVFQWVFLRSLAMIRAAKQTGKDVMFVVDEPALYGFLDSDIYYEIGLKELTWFIQSLKKENVEIGLHCCSNTKWSRILDLPVDWLSVDASLSLFGIVEDEESFKNYLARGGKFIWGVVPTHERASKESVEQSLLQVLCEVIGETKTHEVLHRSLFSPACGLALHTIRRAQEIRGEVIKICQTLF